MQRHQPVLAEPRSLDADQAADYDLAFCPGAHGPMEDLAVDETSARILIERMADKAPWLLEDRLVNLGAQYEKASEPWASYITVDGNPYTGQNPSSSRELAERLVKDLA
ncbi:hypothetical protein Q0N48_03770 [Corynebacterium ureicelerivorans]|uniref:hypothetical protein n=1 Tax=Corynebacterium ureicelerivorans TaxID=401472 RepID=UPI00264E5FDC|nr:hypothetical protein [Corynebacterium ureicelerivorans]MDN8605126.1 hypothetical protein [Corynebacterium ureicelerivorans]